MNIGILLNRIQAIISCTTIRIFVAIQEYGLTNELACYNGCYISMQFENDLFKKSVIVKPLSYRIDDL